MSAAPAGAAIVMAAAPAIKLVLIHFMVDPHSAKWSERTIAAIV
jgi:hypothetical protein